MDSVAIVRNKATVADIKRLEDAAVNPLTGKAWPEGHDSILQGRRKLPVYEKLGDILDVYHQNQVFILSSETGSGKSTQIPQLLLWDEFASGLRIACTQPRRLASTALASRVAQEMGVTLGEEVGYQIGGDKQVDKNEKKTRLAYMTEGVLVKKQASDSKLSEYACIIIDEAHERTVETDILMAMLKKAMHSRKDLKVIIMSATMDAKVFQDYFNGCPLVHITGRNFKVDTYYVKSGQATADFVILAVEVVLSIHRDPAPGNILVFLPGRGEIGRVCALLRKHAKDLDVFPLYSELAPGEQSLALGPSVNRRKCVVSTNIAETSLTIDNIAFVVDSGLSRQMIYNPRFGMNMLQLLPISQASAKQRTGRAGRTRDGTCYRLYSKEAFNDMPLSTEPAVRCQSLHAAALKLSQNKIRVIDFDWITPPHPETIARAAQDLHDWELIKDNGTTTAWGYLAASCPLDPIWYRAIAIGAQNGCSLDIMDIAVICNAQRSIIKRPSECEHVADVLLGVKAGFPSDHLALANAFNSYMKVYVKHKGDPASVDIREWCDVHALDMEALEEVRKAREVCGRFFQFTAKLAPTRASVADLATIRKVLARAFCTQVAMHTLGNDEYVTVHENVRARLHPTSALVGGSDFEWVVYNTLSLSGRKVYLETVTPIDAEWLLDLPYFNEERLPLRGDGTLRQPKVKASLDAARARKEASKTT